MNVFPSSIQASLSTFSADKSANCLCALLKSVSILASSFLDNRDKLLSASASFLFCLEDLARHKTHFGAHSAQETSSAIAKDTDSLPDQDLVIDSSQHDLIHLMLMLLFKCWTAVAFKTNYTCSEVVRETFYGTYLICDQERTVTIQTTNAHDEDTKSTKPRAGSEVVSELKSTCKEALDTLCPAFESKEKSESQ